MIYTAWVHIRERWFCRLRGGGATAAPGGPWPRGDRRREGDRSTLPEVSARRVTLHDIQSEPAPAGDSPVAD